MQLKAWKQHSLAFRVKTCRAMHFAWEFVWIFETGPSKGPRAIALGGTLGRPKNRGSEAIFIGFSCENLQSRAFRLGFCVFFWNAFREVNVAAAWEIMMFFIRTQSWSFQLEKCVKISHRAIPLEICVIFLNPSNGRVWTRLVWRESGVAELL